MRKVLYILLMCLTSTMLARAQFDPTGEQDVGNSSQKTVRIWVDNDFENNCQVTTDSWEVDYDVSNLNVGLHNMNLMAEEGGKASLFTRRFYKTPDKGAGTYGYIWIDDNFQETTIDRTPGDNIIYAILYDSNLIQKYDVNDMDTELDVSGLSAGYHWLNVAVNYHDYDYLAMQRRLFYKLPNVEGVSRVKCVTLIDGAVNKQEELQVDNGIVMYNIDATNISEGMHGIVIQMLTPEGELLSSYTGMFYRRVTTTELANMSFYYSVDGEEAVLASASYTDGGYMIDLDLSALEDGIHQLYYFMKTPGGNQTPPRSAFFRKGSNKMVAYEYWVNNDINSYQYVELQTPSEELSTEGLIEVPSQPLRTELFHFDIVNEQPTMYAKNTISFNFYDNMYNRAGICKEYVDYNVSKAVSDIEDLHVGTPVSVAVPTEGEIKWYKFSALAGDSLSFKTDKACTIQLFGPKENGSGYEEVYSASAIKAVNYGGCSVWTDGDYYLALHNVTAKKANSIKLESKKIGKYAILSYTPHEVGAKPGSKFNVSLFGNGYDMLQSAHIVLGEEMTISTTEIETTDRNNTTLKFQMPDSPDIPRGKYDLRLDFTFRGKNESFIVEKAIKVADPEEGEIKLSIKSFPVTARPYPVYVSVKNTGNVMKEDVHLAIAYDNLGNILKHSIKTSNKIIIDGEEID